MLSLFPVYHMLNCEGFDNCLKQVEETKKLSIGFSDKNRHLLQKPIFTLSFTSVSVSGTRNCKKVFYSVKFHSFIHNGLGEGGLT